MEVAQSYSSLPHQRITCPATVETSDNAQFHLVVRILADLLQPLFDILEGVLSFNTFDTSYLIRNIVHDEHSIRTVIVGTCDCSESFLPCSIPLPIKGIA